MCGIAGIISYNHNPVTESTLKLMGEAIKHRGPDDHGIWQNNNIGLVHQRLSIIDTSSNGHQPMTSTDNRYTIVFNGEIYNHNEFRTELKQKGFVFNSTSDTEVLLYLYIVYGEKMLHRLNGMFAFAIWDNHKQELFICRDRYGVKPLYYSNHSSGYYFASEAKALFAAGIPKSIKEENINEWLLYRYVAGSETLYDNIYKLLPGHYALVKPNKSIQYKRWYHLGERIAAHSTISNPENWFKDTFYNSIQYRMVSDVPVGLLLSGGLDSSSIAAGLHNAGYQNIQTFNIGFHQQQHDESILAKNFSEQLNYPFHSILLEGDDLYGMLLKAIDHLDEPLIHFNDPHILAIAQYASKYVKVLLSGEGADELMGGYVRYKPFRYYQLFPLLKGLFNSVPSSILNTRLLKLKRYLNNGSIDLLIKSNAANYYRNDFQHLGLDEMIISNPYRLEILEEAKSYFPNNPTRQLLYYDQHTYLQSLNERNDKATMAASIECREPFQDYRLVEGLGTLHIDWLTSGKKGKHILQKTMSPYLPADILSHRKIGLSVPWMTHILENKKLQQEWDSFCKNPSLHSTTADAIPMQTIVKNLKEGKNQEYQLLALQYFMFHLWRKG